MQGIVTPRIVTSGIVMRSAVRRAALLLALAAIALLSLPATAGARVARAAGSDVVEYVGVVKGEKPYVNGKPQKEAYFVAIAVAPDGKVVAYTCDGFGESANFSGTEENGTFTAEDGGAKIDATITDRRARGTLTLEGQTWDIDLKKARDVGGLYTVKIRAGANGTITGAGTSERGNTLTITAKQGQKKPKFTFDPVGGVKRTVFATPLNPPKDLLGLDSYRAVFLDSGRMGRGNATINAQTVTASTNVVLNTIRIVTSTTIQFY